MGGAWRGWVTKGTGKCRSQKGHCTREGATSSSAASMRSWAPCPTAHKANVCESHVCRGLHACVDSPVRARPPRVPACAPCARAPPPSPPRVAPPRRASATPAAKWACVFVCERARAGFKPLTSSGVLNVPSAGNLGRSCRPPPQAIARQHIQTPTHSSPLTSSGVMIAASARMRSMSSGRSVTTRGGRGLPPLLAVVAWCCGGAWPPPPPRFAPAPPPRCCCLPACCWRSAPACVCACDAGVIAGAVQITGAAQLRQAGRSGVGALDAATRAARAKRARAPHLAAAAKERLVHGARAADDSVPAPWVTYDQRGRESGESARARASLTLQACPCARIPGLRLTPRDPLSQWLSF